MVRLFTHLDEIRTHGRLKRIKRATRTILQVHCTVHPSSIAIPSSPWRRPQPKRQPQVKTIHFCIRLCISTGKSTDVTIFSLFACHSPSTARTATADFYRPFLAAINAVYLVLRWALTGFQMSWTELLLITCIGGLQMYAYIGIMDSAANQSTTDKRLAGGASLDLLGLTLVVQFGSILISSKCYWLLAALPIWGAWTVYAMFGGGISSLTGGGKKAAGAPPSEINDTDGKEKLDERRQKRADRRRQKWS
jgi:hypothetical protein